MHATQWWWTAGIDCVIRIYVGEDSIDDSLEGSGRMTSNTGRQDYLQIIIIIIIIIIIESYT